MRKLLLVLALLWLSPAQAQYYSGGDPAFVLPQTTLVTNSFTTAPTATRKALINTTVNTMEACGAWDRLDILYVTAAATSQAANINWKNPGVLTLTVGGGTPAFTADRGYAGDAVSAYLTTGYNPSSSSLGMAQNDASLGVWVLATSASTNFDINSDNARLSVRARSSNGAQGTISSTTLLAAATNAAAVPPHLISLNRTSSAGGQVILRNGVTTNSDAVASNGLPTTITLLGNAARSQFSDRTVMWAWVGRGLTIPQHACMYTASLAYLQGVGAAP